MITFKSTEDLSKLPPNDPAFPIVEDLVKRLITDYISEGYEYRPADDGWIAVIEEQDKDKETKIVLKYADGSFDVHERKLREMEDPRGIFFEKNWASYLTGNIYKEGFKHE